MSPNNTEYLRALRGFLDTQLVLNSGIIVADQNDDRYTRSLREAFVRELPGFVRLPDLPFNGGTIPSGADAGVFNPVVTNLCNAANDPDPVNRLDTVLYAGRVADFRGFVEANGFDDRSLGDGYAIMYHDALASTATAVRLAAQATASRKHGT